MFHLVSQMVFVCSLFHPRTNPEGFGITHKRNKSRICHKYQTVEPLNGWGPSSPEQWAKVDGRIYLRSSFSSGRSFITIVILLILPLPFREIVWISHDYDNCDRSPMTIVIYLFEKAWLWQIVLYLYIICHFVKSVVINRSVNLSQKCHIFRYGCTKTGHILCDGSDRWDWIPWIRNLGLLN